MMKFIKMDFPIYLFLKKEHKKNSFYDEVLPEERMEAVGFFQVPVFPLVNTSEEKTKTLTRKLM